MDITEVKAKLGYSSLQLNTAMDKDNKPTDWMRHWDNDARVAVSIHKDTVAAVKSDATLNLGLQTEQRTGDKGAYTAYRIVKYSEAETTL